MTKKMVKRTDANNEILYFYTHSDVVDVGEGNNTTSLTNALNNKANTSDVQTLSNDTLRKSPQSLSSQEKTQALTNLGLNGVDDEPTPNSDNLVKSGGVQNELALGAVYDVSAKNPTAGPNNDGKFESLSALLSDANINTLIPIAVRKGGMSIKFVLSSDNKYVQYRYMGTDVTGNPNPFLDVTNWQGVDEEILPTISKNLASGGAVRKALGNAKYDWVSGKNIDLSGGVGTTVPEPATVGGWGYCDIPCDEGSIVIVSGNGGNYGLWGFVDDENKIIDWSGKNKNLNDLELIAPEGAVRVIVNSYNYASDNRKPPVVSLSGSVDARIKNIVIKAENIQDNAVSASKIQNSAITTSKVADKAVNISKLNLDIITETGTYDYTDSIAELYVTAPISDGCFLSIKVYRGEFFLRSVNAQGQYPSQYWIAKIVDLTSVQDNVVVPLECTVGNDVLGVSVGDIVGYVIYKNINKISGYRDTTTGYKIENTSWVYDIANSPIIALYVQKIPESILEDNFIVPTKVGSTIYDIRYCINEFYLKEDAVIFNNDSHKYVCCKVYGTNLYVISYSGVNNNYGWVSSLDISAAENGVVYELKVTTAGLNEDYSVGDIVGYIVFEDIDTLKTKTTGTNTENVIRSNVIQMVLSPMVYAYIQTKSVEIDGVLTFAHVQIPSDIYIVTGNQLMLFYKSIIKSYNPDLYGIRVVCSVGKAYPKYYILDADTIGDYSISFNIVDKDDNTISTKTSTIHIISAMDSPSANKNVLVFGASTMTDGSVTGELKRRLTENSGDGTTQNPTGLGLNNIAFVGRKQGTVVNVNQEATGGWSWKDYTTEGQPAYRFYVSGVSQLHIGDKYTNNGVTLTITEINVTSGSGNIRCTYSGTNTLPASGVLTRSSGSGDLTISYGSYDSESYNPFWNPNKTGGAGLDFINYANEYCNGSIDVMVSCFGYNDFNRYTPASIGNLFTDYIKPFIRAYHSDFPNGKFIISLLTVPTPNGGMAANYGASSTWNWLTTSLKVWAFDEEVEKLVKESEFSSYVSLANVTSEFDCEHSYPTAQAYVNNRSSEQETVTTNGVHFTTVGAYQVSDSLYHAFNRLNL